MTGRRLRAVDAASPLDDIEVEFQNAGFAQAPLHPQGDQGFRQFSPEGFLGIEVEIFRQLLGDRAAPAVEPARLHVALQRIPGRLPIDAVVPVELGILGDDDGVAQRGRDL